MVDKSPIKLLISILILASLACGLSDIIPTTSPKKSESELQTAVAKRLAETEAVQTAIALGIAGTLGPGQPDIPPGPPQILPDLPSLTPSITLSPMPDKVMASVSQLTNCRSGPGAVYDWLGALNVGQESEVIARDPDNSSWYIRNPNNPSSFCWIWNTYTTISGNPGTLPVYTPIPTPTPGKTTTPTSPPIDFNVVYKGVSFCPGWGYYLSFTITNNGDLTWQSWQSIVTDNDTTITVLYQEDKFHIFDCGAGLNHQDDLTPGEPGEIHSDGLPDNPAGHLMTANIKMCSLDGLGGNCLTKTINFTP